MNNIKAKMICGIALVVLGLITPNADAAVVEWKKATSDGDWGTAGNWYQGVVPGPEDYVLIWGRQVITHMPKVYYNAGVVSYLGLNWNAATNQTAQLTITGPSAFLKASVGTYLNRAIGDSNAKNGLRAQIDVLEGAAFQTSKLRMGAGLDNRIEINVGAKSAFHVWNPIASTPGVVDWGRGDHHINLQGEGATFSMTGPGDQSDLIQSWIDAGYITRNTETTSGFSFSFKPDGNLTTLVAMP